MRVTIWSLALIAHNSPGYSITTQAGQEITDLRFRGQKVRYKIDGQNQTCENPGQVLEIKD
jgi:hypothetical protein